MDSNLVNMNNTLENDFRMIIAGGKTGGHLFPAIAVAQAVLQLKPNAQILFVGTGEPFEINTLSRYGFNHKKISSAGIKGKSIFEKIMAAAQIPVSIIQAIAIIRDFKPDIVLGVGGFSSGPVIVAAKFCNVKIAVHEQNSIAGVTNRIVQNFADLICTSFKETKGLRLSKKVVHTGNPIRKNEISYLLSSDKDDNDASLLNNGDNKDERKFTILVTGGSQGARSINTAFIEALKLIKYRKKYRIIHQTGAVDESRVLLEYEKLRKERGKSNCDDQFERLSVGAFFNDLPSMQASADLIICRAGAGTISEITSIGKAAILVPYPYAADDHQTFNAKHLSDKSAAWLIEDSLLSGEILSEKIEFAASHLEEVEQMAQRAKELGNPFADEMIASLCIKMATESLKEKE